MFSEITVIGGGASGLMAAFSAARTISESSSEASVTVLEKMPRPGRKIMITGKGRCNFTNLKDWESFSSHIRSKASLVRPAFFNFQPAKAIEFFENQGIPTVVERGDRAFPASHMASDIVDGLVKAATSLGVRIMSGVQVGKVAYDSGDRVFNIQAGERTFSCRCLIIATGGLSYPSTGSSGDGYSFASSFGHSISPLFPSLTAMVPRGYKIHGASGGELRGHIDRSVPLSAAGKQLMGISLKNTGLTLFLDGREVRSVTGDLDFTDGGLEGPLGFQVSRECVKGIVNGRKAGISIDMKPAVDTAELLERLRRLWAEIKADPRSRGINPERMFRILLGKVLPHGLIDGFLGWNPGLGKGADLEGLAHRLKDWHMDIEGFVGYERAVVTAGGIPPEEVVAKTLESKKQKGLYLCGEVLDVDADTGGYNLQCAFSTGFLAGQCAAQSVICR